MKEIRKHIEENLEGATREYDDTYYHWRRATDAFNSMKTELESLTASLVKAKTTMEDFQKLLDELNNEGGQNG